MQSFEFYNPVRILFGKEQLSKISVLIPAGKKILLLYGGGSIKRNGVYSGIYKALKSFKVVEFGGIEPNPTYETSMKAVEVIKEQKIDFLLAAGGGSVIDATKFIAAAALWKDGDPWKILSEKKPVAEALPLGAVLTLPATGTEMNKNSVMSRKSTNEKLAFASDWSYPQFSILLPDAAGTLPPEQVANGVVDAFIHVIEQYLTYPVNAPLQDRFAESILQTLIEEGPKAFSDPSDYDAMSNLMWSATMALNGLIQCGVPGDWSVHNIGHEITAFHGIDHGRTLAIVLPGLWKVWNIREGSEDERVSKAIDKTVEFFESLGIKTKLSDYSVGRETIDQIVSRFEKRGWRRMGDRGLITPSVVRKILETQL